LSRLGGYDSFTFGSVATGPLVLPWKGLALPVEPVFWKYHQTEVASTPEIAPKILGFHTAALDGIGPNIVDFVGFIP
jgi:hypothetical protein